MYQKLRAASEEAVIFTVQSKVESWLHSDLLWNIAVKLSMMRLFL